MIKTGIENVENVIVKAKERVDQRIQDGKQRIKGECILMQSLVGMGVLTSHQPSGEVGRSCPHHHPTQEIGDYLSHAPLKFSSFVPSNSSNFSSTFTSCPWGSTPNLPPAESACSFLFLSLLPRLASGESNLPPSHFCDRPSGVQ